MRRYGLTRAESINDMNLAFVQESYVYDYLRPRRNLLAACVEFTLWHHMPAKGKPPVLNQEAQKTCVKKRRLSG
jgi:hypothetical protein